MTHDSAEDDAPSFSPDGSKIVYKSNRHGSSGDIIVMNADGGEPHNLTNSQAFDADPAFGPDGRITFSSNRDGKFQLYQMASDGSGLVRLTSDALEKFQPALSPDGSRIAFAAGPTAASTFDIYVMNAAGTQITNLTNNPAFDAAPVFTPDSRRIMFYSDRDGNAEIYVMNADGSVPTRLTHNPGLDALPDVR